MRNILAALGLVATATSASAHNYKEGQIWAYHTRPSESASTLLINKIEPNKKLGSIFHISVLNVRVVNTKVNGGATTELPHFPVSLETLKKSTTKLVGTSKPNPDYIEGYKVWREAFDAGEAGIFTISVSEIVGFIESVVNQKQ